MRDKIPDMKRLMMVFAVFFGLAAVMLAQKPAAVGKPNSYSSVDARAQHWPDSVTGTVEKLGGYVNSRFSTPAEKTRAIFIWIAANIEYDVANMFAIDFYEERGETIAKPLRTRKGICENYAGLFVAVCEQVGIRAVVVEGYTKQRGFVDFIPHAWCAAFVDGSWALYDPTWGSGYMENNRFVRKLNETFFKAAPETFVASHMPFDYLWEFLSYPVTNQEFYEGKFLVDKTKAYFSYADSIRVYLALSAIEQEKAEAIRVEKNGLRNSMLFDRLRHLKVDIENARRQAENDRANHVIDAYNSSLRNYNNAVRQFNVFINYRNGEFKPLRPDAEIQQLLDSADHELQRGRAGAGAIALTGEDTRVQQALQPMKEGADDLAARIKEQQDWLLKYFSKGKMGRKGMFSRYTWLGIPIN
jgi:hypothetical protein